MKRAGGGCTGNFPEEIREQNWENFETDTKFASDGKYFFFIERENGEVCIVKYALKAYFAGNHPVLNRIGPENILPLIFPVLFLLQVIASSQDFFKKGSGVVSCTKSGNRKNWK